MAVHVARRPGATVASLRPELRRLQAAGTPRVALLIETSRAFGRRLLSGIARYAQEHGPWSFYVTPCGENPRIPQMRQWGGTGIIARVSNDGMAEAVLQAKVPAVAICLASERPAADSPQARFATIGGPVPEAAHLAAEHFLERRFHHFAYVGVADCRWSDQRGDSFRQRLQSEGLGPHVYLLPARLADRAWEYEQSLLASWIRRLPKPVGLFAANDDRGRQVLEACRLAELRVPEDVAVLGVDDDEVFCTLASPPLSSVALNAESAGYRAAEALDAMMHGRIKGPCRIVVEAERVMARRSTDIVAVEDEDVAAALRYIHREHGRHISVENVVREVAISRRNLEKRFRETIDRTILEEIQTARLEWAKSLLVETSDSVGRIGEQTGFGSTAYFIQFFQSRVGLTPRRFRVESASAAVKCERAAHNPIAD